MEKKLSCGFIIQDIKTNDFLGCLPWGFKEDLCDLPKGQKNNNESYLSCAYRELLEETGIKQDDVHDIIELGMFEYLKDKDVYLFYGRTNIDPMNLHCDSTFINKWGKEVPEMRGFRLGGIDIFRPKIKIPIELALNKLKHI